MVKGLKFQTRLEDSGKFLHCRHQINIQTHPNIPTDDSRKDRGAMSIKGMEICPQLSPSKLQQKRRNAKNAKTCVCLVSCQFFVFFPDHSLERNKKMEKCTFIHYFHIHIFSNIGFMVVNFLQRNPEWWILCDKRNNKFQYSFLPRCREMSLWSVLQRSVEKV